MSSDNTDGDYLAEVHWLADRFGELAAGRTDAVIRAALVIFLADFLAQDPYDTPEESLDDLKKVVLDMIVAIKAEEAGDNDNDDEE